MATVPTAVGAPKGRRVRRLRTVGRPSPLVYTAVVLVVIASLFPLYWSFIVASRDNSAVGAGAPVLTPGGYLFDNIARVFDTVDFWAALQNSLIIASTTTVANVLFSSLAGFAFTKLRFRGRNLLLGAVIATVMVPTQLGIVPLYMLVTDLGLTGVSAVILPTLVSAFGVFWMRQAIDETIPDELVEAARVDGANLLRVWWHVVLPGVRSQAAVLGMFVFMTSWNDFFYPLIVMPPDTGGTVQTALNVLASGYYQDYSLMMAGSVLAVLPLLIAFVFFSRQLVSGVMAGAVKG
ncbi:carbohydrate ABC transporter permease [Allostreptomyces psammosilenae]|uniref:Cellobiose transport system permease protein n=1 Tax=Allostreptomyces psammosilenae TaxID=1892865 RepID=A0A852ZQZ4_9ACTN|nr:carbohydrate ABC transporter permease [Allostreptomyces psammosilenae]NYI03274.1 cellobiose transport system permease protein [Allostreptomyces psammosilenae]